MAKEAKQGYKKNLGTILLLAFAGSIIYGLPYFRSYYYDTYQNMYNLTNTQMGLLGSAYGLLGVFSYVIGGVLADKIKAKKLLIFSMIATGLGGLLHLVVSDFYALAAIYGLWGVTSLLAGPDEDCKDPGDGRGAEQGLWHFRGRPGRVQCGASGCGNCDLRRVRGEGNALYGN